MTTITAEVFETLSNHAEAIRNDDPHDLSETMEAGDAWAQGDLLISRIKALPADAEPVAEPEAQLAPGTTQGSRHVLGTLDGVTMYRRRGGTVLDGPVFVTDAPAWVRHPEHGDVLLPAGVYAIAYQRAFGDELRRTLD